METTQTNVEKKRLLIYVLTAYGITYVMGLLMWYGNSRGMDVSAFPNAQMMYPAAGVMLGFLLTEKGSKMLPKGFFLVFLAVTVLMVIASVLSVIFPDELVGAAAGSPWLLIIQLAIQLGSLLCWIFLLAAGKERRSRYGLRGGNWKLSAACILLFVCLYGLRTVVSAAMGGQLATLQLVMGSPSTWYLAALLPLQFFLVMIAFFGEEYGWRYYLQPLLQEKFGLKGGVLVLGVVWGLWHLPVDFFYYSPGYGLQTAVAQQITCITLGIFFAYAYMKTQNIWVPVILHFLNNNLVAVISGNHTASVLENQVVTWGSLLPALLLNGILFGLFIFTKPFCRNKEIQR